MTLAQATQLQSCASEVYPNFLHLFNEMFYKGERSRSGSLNMDGQDQKLVDGHLITYKSHIILYSNIDHS